ncbi:MAG: tyrosine-type recombinase/integrase, partial [Dehalococcoidia bacterium]
MSCKVENKSPATISFYKNILDKFRWFLEKNSIQDIDANTIRNFLGYLKDTPNRWDTNNARANNPVSPVTVKSYYIGLSALFTWAMEEGLIEHNPMTNVKKPKLPNRTVKGLDTEVVRKLIDEVNGRDVSALRNKAMLYMFLDTGLRLSELTGLMLSDIDFKNGIIKTIGKGNKERYARIGVKTQKALWNYLAVRPVDTEHVWQGKANGKMTKDGIAQMIRKLGKRL